MTKRGALLGGVAFAGVFWTAACGTQQWSFDVQASQSPEGAAPPIDAAGGEPEASPVVEASQPPAPEAGPDTESGAESGVEASREAACSSQNDCPSTAPVCRTPGGVCGPCTANADCATVLAGHMCLVSTGQCVGCLANTDCRQGICDTTTHSCVDI